MQHTTWFVKSCRNNAALRSTRGGSCVGIAWGVFRHLASPSSRLPAAQPGVEMLLRPRMGWSSAPQSAATSSSHSMARAACKKRNLHWRSYGTCRACTQVAWLLFYFCAVPRANHLLRTVPPQQVAPYAIAHDQQMHMEFRRLLGLASAEHDAVLHGLSEEVWARRAKMPVRMGGCGLRDSVRTAPAAYWASWADCLHSLHERCPRLGHVILNALTAAKSQGPVAQGIPQGILAAACAGQAFEALGMQARPLWQALCEGAPPPSADAPDRVPGEWLQGCMAAFGKQCV